ncbi:SDR family NAD(P)-dependent oxidoreductase [Nocardioides sp. B-3]|uniref:SDR family NAD(P)-dependent oxidoreductase n=1 Tax=Nocardioides sp. B-3 TaxID=2895565 RepID=UPI0021532CAA|nr:SDR family oxidoreductase [Nocardioides sp. B-3]UUZ59432.1 SDR family oxidoreductase [Nocardioides sp. B-3]
MSASRFDGTKVPVTGGASGIGRATVQRLVSEGALVFAVDLDVEGLASLEGVHTHVADVSSEEAVVTAVAAAVETLGGIDVLINVAGIHRTTPIETLSVDDLTRLFAVNTVGPAIFCREALRHLPDGTGVIVNVTSSSAAHGNPYMTAYSASKGALLAFSLALAAEVVHRGIRVVPVSPGTTATPLIEGIPADLDMSYYARIRSLMGPATPEQIAGVIAFAASPDAAYITGAEIRADGGSHV